MNDIENYFNVKSDEKMRVFIDDKQGFEGNYQHVILTVGKIVQYFGFININTLTEHNKELPIERIFRIAETYTHDIFDFTKLNDDYTEINLNDVSYEWWGMIGYLYSKNCLPEYAQNLIRPRVKHNEKYNNNYSFSSDENIYHLMNVLNNAGYGTRFSCEGNIYSVKNDLFSAGYVKFSDDVNVDEILTKLENNGISYSSKNGNIIMDNIFPKDNTVTSISDNLHKKLILIDDSSYIGNFKKFSFLNNELFINGEKKLDDCKLLTHTVIALPYSILKLNEHTVRFGMGFDLDELANLSKSNCVV